MDKLSNLALLAQMLESAEKNIQSARQLLKEVMAGDGGPPPKTGKQKAKVAEKAKTLGATSSEGRIIEGVFDGQNMIGPDGKKYPVPANYASKSKLVEGDVLKLTIADDGSFIYKQIGPIERTKKIGTLTQTENSEYRVLVDGKAYKVLLASLTYFKAKPGDEVTIIVPEEEESDWAAVENVINKNEGSPADMEMQADEDEDEDDDDLDMDLELDDNDDDDEEDSEEESSEDEEGVEASDEELENFHV